MDAREGQGGDSREGVRRERHIRGERGGGSRGSGPAQGRGVREGARRHDRHHGGGRARRGRGASKPRRRVWRRGLGRPPGRLHPSGHARGRRGGGGRARREALPARRASVRRDRGGAAARGHRGGAGRGGAGRGGGGARGQRRIFRLRSGGPRVRRRDGPRRGLRRCGLGRRGPGAGAEAQGRPGRCAARPRRAVRGAGDGVRL